jgi:HAE1 family hydrophobic/amphiphilic exporter-1
MERHAALLHACPVRLRPILMTSVATIAGALPPALALGPGAELQRPMALALVGGMIVSTGFTLFVVPAGLQPDRRRGGVERRAQVARRRARRRAARSPQRLRRA